jgi:hypothetical protein
MRTSIYSRGFYFSAGLCALSVTPLLHAGVIFQTGFESTDAPAYATGQLAGQNGWTGLTTPVVENSTVFSGSQAVSFASTGLSGQNLIRNPITYNSLTDPAQTVVYDIHFMESTTGTASNWTVVGTSGAGGFIGAIVLTGSTGLVNDGYGNSVAVTRGTWNDFQLTLDFKTQTYGASVNAQPLGSGAFFNASTDLTSFGFGINSVPGSDVGFFDQVSINSVPEPGYAGLLVAAMGLIALRARKTRLSQMRW